MAIGSIGYGATVLSQSVLNVKSQLDSLQTQLASGKKAPTYAGMGINEGFAIAARAQLANISAFTDTMTNVSTTISASNTALQALVDIAGTVRSSLATASPALDSTGQTLTQQTAASQLSSFLSVLNTQVGDRYIFSGSATDTAAVTDADTLLNGTVTQAGLRQVIAERQEADVGAAGTGRIALSLPAATTLQLDDDASPFGFKLDAITSHLTNAVVIQPAGSPQQASIDLGGGNPITGETISFSFTLPDGTKESITLTASSASPVPAGSFAIGAAPADTVNNLNAALTTALQDLADTKLAGASAVQATNDFFGSPPQRVDGPPFDTATGLIDGTAADTVIWYTGEAGGGAARAAAMARIDQTITVQYGARASEQAIVDQLKALAALAAVQTPPGDPDSAAQSLSLSQRVAQNMAVQPGRQTLQDMQADFANAKTIMNDVTARHQQAKGMLQGVVDQTESISQEEVVSQILALQTALQASYQTTARLSQLSLVNFLP